MGGQREKESGREKVAASVPGWNSSKHCPGSPGKESSAGSYSSSCSWTGFSLLDVFCPPCTSLLQPLPH